MTDPHVVVPKWKQEASSWSHAALIGALSAAAAVFDNPFSVFSFRGFLHTVIFGILSKLVAMGIKKVGP